MKASRYTRVEADTLWRALYSRRALTDRVGEYLSQYPGVRGACSYQGLL